MYESQKSDVIFHFYIKPLNGDIFIISRADGKSNNECFLS